MRNHAISRSHSEGSLSIEAALVVPLVLLLLSVWVLLIISEVRFDGFEQRLTEALVQSTGRTLCAEDLLTMVIRDEDLTLEALDYEPGTLTVSLSFRGGFWRRWHIRYPFSRIPFERLVYVTDTGVRYHGDGCIHLRRSRVPRVYSEVLGTHGPCKVCTLNP